MASVGSTAASASRVSATKGIKGFDFGLRRWLMYGHAGGGQELQRQTTPSLLSDWKSYASSQDSSISCTIAGFYLESAVRTANDSVSGTFDVVTKGVRDLPGNFQSATSNIPSGKFLIYFGLILATEVLFIFMAFTLFLPVIVNIVCYACWSIPF